MQRIISEDFLCKVIFGVLSFILGKVKYNKEVANLFGITSIVMTSDDGQKCFNINQPAVEERMMMDGRKLWKQRENSEVLRFNDDTI